MRFIHRPINKVIGGFNSTYLHGEKDSSFYYESGSQTSKNDEKLSKILDTASSLNIEYLTKKWGSGWRYLQPNPAPFLEGEKNIDITTYDLNFVRSKYTDF
jgi:hypothetical protein